MHFDGEPPLPLKEAWITLTKVQWSGIYLPTTVEV
jgi:hypothetical protein